MAPAIQKLDLSQITSHPLFKKYPSTEEAAEEEASARPKSLPTVPKSTTVLPPTPPASTSSSNHVNKQVESVKIDVKLVDDENNNSSMKAGEPLRTRPAVKRSEKRNTIAVDKGFRVPAIARPTIPSMHSPPQRHRFSSVSMMDGVYNNNLPSPRPNVVLPNFSISSYVESRRPRRPSWCEWD